MLLHGGEKSTENEMLCYPTASEVTVQGGVQEPKLSQLRRAFIVVETRGLEPVPQVEQTDKRAFSLLTLWFTANFCLLPYVTSSPSMLDGTDKCQQAGHGYVRPSGLRFRP